MYKSSFISNSIISARGYKHQISFFKPVIQPKLTINQPNDIYEQEATAVAEQIMRMPGDENTFFRPAANLIQRKCAHCEEEEKKVQMKGGKSALSSLTVPPIVDNAIYTTGQPLDTSTRNFMESKFGYDFGNVQIHNNSLAHHSTADINASAYTHGNHVVFAAGKYRPDTNSGKKLLAHELVHVVQQNNSNGNLVQKQGIDDVEEESARQGERFREARHRDLSKAIDLMKFKKIRADCPKNTNIKLSDVLAGMRNRVAQNEKCIKFFKDKFKINPDILLDPKRKPSITFDPTLKISGVTRCPEPSIDSPIPSVSIGNVCNSPHLERVIMHELTHYAQCLVKWGQTSSEEIAEEGAVICMGTVQEALDNAKKKKEQKK